MKIKWTIYFFDTREKRIDICSFEIAFELPTDEFAFGETRGVSMVKFLSKKEMTVKYSTLTC